MVLVLLRKNGLSEASRAVRDLKKTGRRVLISWKESGQHQVAAALADGARYMAFREICASADGFISSTPDLVSLYRAAGAQTGDFIPTPYPVEDPAWDFSAPLSGRAGIFIGTREFDVPSRNHLQAVALASQCGPLTVMNPDGKKGERLLRAIAPDIRIVPAPLPYPDYLRLIASHRVVFQMDRSAVPGQVAGDALLARVIAVGGDGAVDREAFPDFVGIGRSADELAGILRGLLSDDGFYKRQVAVSQRLAHDRLGFHAVAARLASLFAA